MNHVLYLLKPLGDISIYAADLTSSFFYYLAIFIKPIVFILPPGSSEDIEELIEELLKLFKRGQISEELFILLLSFLVGIAAYLIITRLGPRPRGTRVQLSLILLGGERDPSGNRQVVFAFTDLMDPQMTLFCCIINRLPFSTGWQEARPTYQGVRRLAFFNWSQIIPYAQRRSHVNYLGPVLGENDDHISVGITSNAWFLIIFIAKAMNITLTTGCEGDELYEINYSSLRLQNGSLAVNIRGRIGRLA